MPFPVSPVLKREPFLLCSGIGAACSQARECLQPWARTVEKAGAEQAGTGKVVYLLLGPRGPREGGRDKAVCLAWILCLGASRVQSSPSCCGADGAMQGTEMSKAQLEPCRSFQRMRKELCLQQPHGGPFTFGCRLTVFKVPAHLCSFARAVITQTR